MSSSVIFLASNKRSKTSSRGMGRCPEIQYLIVSAKRVCVMPTGSRRKMMVRSSSALIVAMSLASRDVISRLACYAAQCRTRPCLTLPTGASCIGGAAQAGTEWLVRGPKHNKLCHWSQRPQTSSDPAYYRKHDWPSAGDMEHATTGYQASDSVAELRGGRTLVLQTFDFGDRPRTFGRFDSGHGDGGQVVVLANRWASAIMTEDGGAGVQWFIGPGCRSAVKADAGFISWIFFGSDVELGQWHHMIAFLNRASGPTGCPWKFNAAYTRYRADQIEMIFRKVPRGGVIQTVARKMDVIVSEHYGGRNITSADHLERFYFARDLGLIRWERWENFALLRPPDIHQMADLIAISRRCMPLPYSAPPTIKWRMIDCRSWTTFIEEVGNWSVERFQWSAPDMLGLRSKAAQ
jgi:hypothetical protein